MRRLVIIVMLVFGAAVARAGQWKIGVSQCDARDPWRAQMNSDIAAAATARGGVQVIFKDAAGDVRTQIAQINELVAEHVNAILVTPLNAAALTPVIKTAYAQGVVVIVLETRLTGRKYTCFVDADNKSIGRALAHQLVRSLLNTGSVLVLKGDMTRPQLQDWHSGFLAALAASGVDIAKTVETGGRTDVARRAVEELLASGKHVDAIVGYRDSLALIAWQVLKERGQTAQTQCISIEGLPREGRAYVDSGMFEATLEWPTGGREALAIALRALDGYNVEVELTVGSRLFTKQNSAAGGEEIR